MSVYFNKREYFSNKMKGDQESNNYSRKKAQETINI